MRHIFALMISSIIFLVVFNNGLYSQFIESPEFIASKIKNAYKSIREFECAFQMRNERSGKVKKSNGKLFYKPGGKILAKFYHPNGQKICSNGKTIWIYIPKLNVVFSHKFKKGDNTGLTGVVLNNMNLFKKYNMSFNTPKIVKKWKVNFYSMRLTPKVTALGFKELNILVSRQGYIQQIIGLNYNGDVTKISFTNIKVNKSINEDFNFDIPTNSQEMTNPFSNLEN